jgi:hypothetical protein
VKEKRVQREKLHFREEETEFLATDKEVRLRFLALPDFLRVVSLERGPLNLVSTIEGLLGRKSSGSGLETETTAVGIRSADYATSIRKRLH